MSGRVYIGGPIAGLSLVEAQARRAEAVERLRMLGITPVNPMRDVIRFNDEVDAHPPDTLCVTRDLADIRSCNVVLMDFRGAKTVSIGSSVEIGYAAAGGKPIVVVMGNTNPHQHMFVRELAAVVTESMDYAIQAVQFMLATPAGG